MKKIINRILIILLVLGVFSPVAGFGIKAFNTYSRNKTEFHIQKIDDTTKYETIKKVEDTARSMISSYESDKLTYDQYKDSENEDEKSWAQQAKMRANKTASSYNNYLLKNSFVWEGNIPGDIKTELLIIQ